MGAVIQSRSRAGRKLRDVRSWVDSVRTPVDWPAAMLLAVCRTRPSVADAAKAMFGRVWLRPRLLRGIRVSIDPSSPAQFSVYEEVFINQLYDLTRLSFEPDAVLDCGAFEGYFSLLARAHFGTPAIIAFEPNATNFNGLVTNTSQGALGIASQPAAVSTVDGEAAFCGSGCGGHLGHDAGAVTVAVRNLCAVIAELQPQRLLLKLDIEGEEANLLPAILPLLPRRCAIFFEWHHGADSYTQLASLLTTNNFEVSLVRTHEFDGVTFIDAFAQRN